MLPEKRVMTLASRCSKLARASSSTRRRRSASMFRRRELFRESGSGGGIVGGRDIAPLNGLLFGGVPTADATGVAPPDCSPYVARLPFSRHRAPVAQLDRAPDYESGGQRFESFRARHFPFRAGPMRSLPFVALLAVTACTSAGGPYPSLRPRPAEAIDPRVEPARPVNDRPVAPALAAQLGALVAQARDGDAAFRPAAAQA